MTESAIYDKTIKCPVCKQNFTTKKAKAKSIKVTKRDTDFRAEYESVNPTYYGVDVCPNCGHARFESDFQDINEATRKMIQDKISAKWNNKNLCGERTITDAIDAHKLALLNYNITHYKMSTIAKVCLRLSWFYHGMESDHEDRFALHALESYEKAYTSENLDEDPKEELTILYLLGELNRRFGRYKKAMDWFTLGLRSPVINDEKFLSESLKEQMRLAKDEYKKEKEAENG
ncbi:MAG: DUF2225 domain-containing protein [Clostridia bacterium]|nr:DUF2225 domain-containing protein [Clostridia bacterium]